MMRVLIRPAAEADIREATDWYEERELGLGEGFVDELRDMLARIRFMPRQFPAVEREVRRALLRRFPYAIYFVIRTDTELVIIAVLHQRRSRRLLKSRARAEFSSGQSARNKLK